MTNVLREVRLTKRAAAMLAAALAILGIAAGVYAVIAFAHRPPPSIFDSPVENVFGYLSMDDFSALPLEERLRYLGELAERFRGLSQSESAAASAFFAELTGAAREQLRENVRLLAKDILLEGADGYLTLDDPAEKAAFLDAWIVRWVRFGRELEGRTSHPSDQELLERLRQDAERDLERQPILLGPAVAQDLINVWETDVAGVTTPAEQGKIFHFLPAVRRHLVEQAP